MTYAGHHKDGSSIQRHSAGPWYPYIVGTQDHELGKWFVMHPSGEIVKRFFVGQNAFNHATSLAKAHQ